MTFEERIHTMTSNEIIAEIFGDAKPWEHVDMTEDMAYAIIHHPAYDLFPRNLQDWAWSSID